MEYRNGSERRDLILQFITKYQKEHGFAPSVSEITSEIGTARSNIHYHLSVLQQEGRIAAQPHTARSWVVRQA